ncbi:shikimate kinase [Paraburkholderia graminis]|uniref:shikimate kinase n=1 Tax=Paraburkholderia graminis TaxID=60548 RepID=UPI003CB3310F
MNTALDMEGRKALCVVQINGPINSGKSTVGRSLAAMLPDARFIDGDDHGAAATLARSEQWAIAIARIECEIETADYRYLVVTYPINHSEFERLLAACGRRSAQFVVVTLNPPLATALSDRGSRKLTAWEKKRIVEMYKEGYHARPFSCLLIDTSCRSPQDCARAIANHVASADSG